MSEERRLERQLQTVRRLVGELRFELLILESMRGRRTNIGDPAVDPDELPHRQSVTEVYAAAVLRRGERRSSS